MMGVEMEAEIEAAADRGAAWLEAAGPDDCARPEMLFAISNAAISAVNSGRSRGGLESAFKIVHPLCGYWLQSLLSMIEQRPRPVKAREAAGMAWC
jgi:hypothetical protein